MYKPIKNHYHIEKYENVYRIMYSKPIYFTFSLGEYDSYEQAEYVVFNMINCDHMEVLISTLNKLQLFTGVMFHHAYSIKVNSWQLYSGEK